MLCFNLRVHSPLSFRTDKKIQNKPYSGNNFSGCLVVVVSP